MNKIKYYLLTLTLTLFTCFFGIGATYYLVPVSQNQAGLATFNASPVQTNYVYSTNVVDEFYSRYVTNYVTITNYVTQNVVVNVYVTNSTPQPFSLTIEAESVAVVSPFVKSGAYIYQPRETSLSGAGKASYNFSVPSAGNYLVVLRIGAPHEGANSIFLNIDAVPTDPATIFDIPVTQSFESRTVNWRGNGTYVSSQFVPKVFTLSAGNHVLNLYGREGGTLIDQIKIVSQ